MKKSKSFIACFIIPALVVLAVVYFYPVARTLCMSFFKTGSVTAPVSTWSFTGLDNYKRVAISPDFRRSLGNMLKIWIGGGVFAIAISLMFGVILSNKNIRGKNFFRAIIYLPNVISAVAIGNAWKHYVYHYDFGLLNKILSWFGIDAVKWLGNDMMLGALIAAMVFGVIGYYMMIFIGGIERIPEDIMEAATLDGASSWQKLTRITLPLLKGTTKTIVTFWTIVSIQSFVWTKVFSPINAEPATIVPISYMYEILFGDLQSSSNDIGTGAAVGVLVAMIIMVITSIINRLLKADDLEL